MAGDLAARQRGQAARNGMIREALAGQGDDGRRVRQVSHYVFPDLAGEAASDGALKAAVAGYGFSARFTAAGDGLILEHEREVASAAFDAEVAGLIETMDQLGWQYDGWDCAVLPAE
ncbi:ribonuclease E inhibitor RraB [Frigidibacter mobilis]|uniref:Regulator of ribonuclease activity B domain-containing protein n=1 Tax=Frigidibacter mobilis TaxID=1335048 RepID=A0A159Z2H3_9RHOB|nr:ribonuclease E inhibitor RraB [Frigidibacter mobilis]AMY69257.1 hypothetical protein AKL17_2008 [Frigidibacter mobilis]